MVRCHPACAAILSCPRASSEQRPLALHFACVPPPYRFARCEMLFTPPVASRGASAPTARALPEALWNFRYSQSICVHTQREHSQVSVLRAERGAMHCMMHGQTISANDISNSLPNDFCLANNLNSLQEANTFQRVCQTVCQTISVWQTI